MFYKGDIGNRASKPETEEERKMNKARNMTAALNLADSVERLLRGDAEMLEEARRVLSREEADKLERLVRRHWRRNNIKA